MTSITNNRGAPQGAPTAPTPVRLATIHGAGGVTFSPTPRTRFTLHGDAGGPMYVSGQRWRRAQARALRAERGRR